MTLPSRFTLTGSAYALDGGTTCLLATDESGGPSNMMVKWLAMRCEKV